MPIDDDRQSQSNSVVGAVARLYAELDAIPGSAPPQPALPDEEVAHLEAVIAAEGAKPKTVQELARETLERIKEHDTRYNQNKRDWEASDARRKAEGREEYNAQRRGEYAGHIMETEGRTVRSYRVPDSEEKRARRRQQKRAKVETMTPTELAAYRTEESRKRAERRRRAKER